MEPTERSRLERELAEQYGSLRAALAMLGLGVLVFALARTSIAGLALFPMIPLVLCAGVFGLGWALVYGFRAARVRRRLRSLTPLPAARVIQR
jgi:hypothetical protein